MILKCCLNALSRAIFVESMRSKLGVAINWALLPPSFVDSSKCIIFCSGYTIQTKHLAELNLSEANLRLIRDRLCCEKIIINDAKFFCKENKTKSVKILQKAWNSFRKNSRTNSDPQKHFNIWTLELK